MVRNEQLEGILEHQQIAAKERQKMFVKELADNPRLEVLSAIFPSEFAIETIGIERIDLMQSYQQARAAQSNDDREGVYMYLGRVVRAAGEENVTLKSLTVKLTAEFPEIMEPTRIHEAYENSRKE